MPHPIYLDNHATTQVDSRVVEAMLPFFTLKFGNASSIDHTYGNEAIQAVNKAKEQIASLIGAEPEEIIFTSGATESNNLAILGTAEALKEKGNHIITSKIEHKAVLDTCRELEKRGFTITYVGVNEDGDLNLEELKSSITDKTILISIMTANHEIGKINSIQEIGKIAKERNVLFHTDATQAFGHIPIDVNVVDMMSASAHKIYGPKGVGILFVRRGFKPKPIMFGGGQQRNIRSGTLNVPAIVGLGVAAEIAQKEMKNEAERLASLRDKLRERLMSQTNVEINGSMANRLAHNLSVYIKDVEAKALINEVKGKVAISAGSACTTDEVKPSYVITALGHDEDRAFSTIRFGLGRFTTEEEIIKTIEVLESTIKTLQNM